MTPTATSAPQTPKQTLPIVEAANENHDPLVMTEEDRRALKTDYPKSEVDRDEAAQFQSLLR